MRAVERCARWVVLCGWMALLSYWSGQGNLPIDQPSIAGPLHGLQHRIAHLIALGLLGLLGRWAFDGLPRAAVLAVVLTSVFGATDEWHQSFTPGRRAAIDDWAMDTAAAALALYLWARLSATRWRTPFRVLAPLAVGAVFVLGVGLAVRPSSLTGLGLRSMTTEAAHGAIQFARDTRDVARQVRSTLTS